MRLQKNVQNNNVYRDFEKTCIITRIYNKENQVQDINLNETVSSNFKNSKTIKYNSQELHF